jgi:hypothetical protein
MIAFTLNKNEIRALERDMLLFAEYTGKTIGDVVKEQAALLQRDLVHEAPPESQSKLRDSIERDIRKVFRPNPPSRGWWPPNSRKSGARVKGTIRWLYATPFMLYGVPRSLDFTGKRAKELLPYYYDQLSRRKLGAKPITRAKVGQRGRQAIVLTYKPIITLQQVTALKKYLESRMGLLKASWAVGWEQLNPGKRLAQWIARHLRKARGETQIDINDRKPSVTFISRAIGTAHPAARWAMKRAVKGRAAKLRAHLRYRMRGWKNKRLIYRQHA